MFGVGRGAYCAYALSRLLGTVGVLPDLMDFVLAAYAVPRTRRSPQDWRRLTRLAERLAGQCEIAVPVQFLGLWDMVKRAGSATSDARTADQCRRGPARRRGRRRLRSAQRSPCGVAGMRRRSLVPRGALRRRRRARGMLAAGGDRAGLDARRRREGRCHGAGRAAKRRRRANTTPSPGARARFRCAGCLPTRWCTPASTSICGRIRSTGGGCPPTWCGPTWSGSLAANGWCSRAGDGAGGTRGAMRPPRRSE